MRTEFPEGSEAGFVVTLRVEHEAVRDPKQPVRLGPKLGPRPRQREVDVEDHRAQHDPRITRTP